MKNNKSHLTTTSIAFTSPLAELANPVRWQATIEKKSAAEYVLTFEAVIAKDWHLYSNNTPKGGPSPLQVQYPDYAKHFQPMGNIVESATVTEYSEIFGVNETFFLEKAKISQTIQISDLSITSVSAVLNYQICKEVCIPQTVNFEFNVPALKADVVKNNLL
jgi:hypothetical protein